MPIETASAIASQLKGQNLPPDFVIDTMYLGDAVFTAKQIDFPGKAITVLNSYIPQNFENMALYYSTDPAQQITLDASLRIIIPKVLLVLPEAVYRVSYEKLYRTLTLSSVNIVNGGTWAFSYLRHLSTPVLVMLSRDIAAEDGGRFKADHFRYAFDSAIPAANAQSSIVVYHGFHDVVKISIYCPTAVNSLRVRARQYDALSNVFADVDVNLLAAGFPYHAVFTLPERDSDHVEILVDGGGAGETSRVALTVSLSRRSV